jgi:acyl carrier protein
MPDTGVLRTVRDVVTDTARAHGWSGEDVIPDTQNLLDGGPRLDSLALADLLVRIEQRFGIVIDESLLDPSDIGSISALAAMVDARLGTDAE